MMKRTFYQRPLPTSCTAFSSEQGKLFFRSALQNNGLKSFYALIEQYSTQTEPAFCGLATLVVALNAMAVDPRQVWKGPWRWYEESMLNCCLDLNQVKEIGVNLRQFECMAHCQGLETELYYGDETDLSEFRQAVRRACVENESDGESPTILVASYSRRILGQTGSGHFSPIAAYDEISDQALILDVARFKYGAHWVPVPLVYKAMQPIDPDTKRSRGYLLLSAPQPPQHTHSDDPTEDRKETMQPALLLFSPMEQRDARLAFKKTFMANPGAEPTFKEIVDYCSEKDWKKLWELTHVQLRPCEEKNEEDEISIRDLVDRMVEVLESLLVRSETHQAVDVTEAMETEKNGCCHNQCRPNFGRTHPVSAMQVAYLVYLAVLGEDKRRELLFSSIDTTSPIDGMARDQLLHEAQLLRVAFEVSDSDIL